MGDFNRGPRRDSGSRGNDRGRSGGRSSGRSFGGGGGFRGNSRPFNREPREMHKAVCAECGQECEVPFKPSGERPVYCRDCYRNKKE